MTDFSQLLMNETDTHTAKIRAELNGKSFREISDYFERMLDEERALSAETANEMYPYFEPGRQLVHHIKNNDSEEKIFILCKSHAGYYDVLKKLVASSFEYVPQKLKDALLLDLVSDNPGPTQATGRPTLGPRNITVLRYFDLVHATTSLLKGSNPATRSCETIVNLVADLFDLTPGTVRDIFTRKNNI